MRIRPAALVWIIVPFLLAVALPCQAAQFSAELTITSPQEILFTMYRSKTI